MSWRVSVGLVLLVGLFGCFFRVESAVALPNGFDKENVVEVPAPTALDFTPDGRMLVASKPGQLYVVDKGQRSVALDLARQAILQTRSTGSRATGTSCWARSCA